MSIIEKLPKSVVDQLYFLKEIFSLEEACLFLSISKSKMYKMTSANKITFYKPEGKALYFRKADLEAFMLRNKITSNDDLGQQAAKMSLNS